METKRVELVTKIFKDVARELEAGTVVWVATKNKAMKLSKGDINSEELTIEWGENVKTVFGPQYFDIYQKPEAEFDLWLENFKNSFFELKPLNRKE